MNSYRITPVPSYIQSPLLAMIWRVADDISRDLIGYSSDFMIGWWSFFDSITIWCERFDKDDQMVMEELDWDNLWHSLSCDSTYLSVD